MSKLFLLCVDMI